MFRRKQAVFLKNHPKLISKTTRKPEGHRWRVRSWLPTGDSRPFHFASKCQSVRFQRRIAQNSLFLSDSLPFLAIHDFSAVSIGRILRFRHCAEMDISYCAE